MSADPLLAWQDLSLRFPNGPELRFPDLSLSRGRHLLLRGASGAGKSSLLALLAGLRQPSSGEVRLAGRALAALKPAQRDAWRGQQIGFLPQRLHLCEGLSLLDNLQLPFVAVGERAPAAQVRALASRLGLSALLDRPVHTLSGGQAQRAALARALVRQPALLLLDEPSSSLDDANTEALLQLVLEVARERQVSLLVATHDARVVGALQTRLGDQLQELAL